MEAILLHPVKNADGTNISRFHHPITRDFEEDHQQTSGGRPSSGKADAQEGVCDVDFLLWFAKKERAHGAGYILTEIEDAIKNNADHAKELDDDYHILEAAKYVVEEEAKETEEEHHCHKNKYMRDKGNAGLRLADFQKMEQARAANLSLAEVAALRCYTTPCFRLINAPLRRIYTERTSKDPYPNAQPHPLKYTTYLVYRAVKKLRACNVFNTGSQSYVRYLWRGVTDQEVPDYFMKSGGTDTACLSTSKDLKVVGKFAKSSRTRCACVLACVRVSVCARACITCWNAFTN